jgi:hypothetical protein
MSKVPRSEGLKSWSLARKLARKCSSMFGGTCVEPTQPFGTYRWDALHPASRTTHLALGRVFSLRYPLLCLHTHRMMLRQSHLVATPVASGLGTARCTAPRATIGGRMSRFGGTVKYRVIDDVLLAVSHASALFSAESRTVAFVYLR